MKAKDLAALTDEMGLLLDWLRMAEERPESHSRKDVELWRIQAEHVFERIEQEGSRKIDQILQRRRAATRRSR